MSAAQDCIARASAPAQDADVTGRLARGLGPGPFALVMLFVSPRADVARIAAETAARLPAAHVVGCTTAGEISEAGYDEGAVLALGFPRDFSQLRCWS